MIRRVLGSFACVACLLLFSSPQCVVGAVLNSGSHTIDIEEDKRSDAARNCFLGAAIYAGFVVVSVFCIVLPGRLCPPKKDDDDSTEVNLLDEYRVQ